jgi:hypothetical protein
MLCRGGTNGIRSVEAPSASGREGPIARAVRAVTHATGHNRAGIIKGGRAMLNTTLRIPACSGAGEYQCRGHPTPELSGPLVAYVSVTQSLAIPSNTGPNKPAHDP